jgi:hypothetical protein
MNQAIANTVPFNAVSAQLFSKAFASSSSSARDASGMEVDKEVTLWEQHGNLEHMRRQSYKVKR